MIDLWHCYGKGLQLINVLRDRGADRQGRTRHTSPAQELATKPEAPKFSR